MDWLAIIFISIFIFLTNYKFYKYIFEALVTNQYKDLEGYPYDEPTILGMNIGLDNCIYIVLGVAVIFHALALIALKVQTSKITA